MELLGVCKMQFLHDDDLNFFINYEKKPPSTLIKSTSPWQHTVDTIYIYIYKQLINRVEILVWPQNIFKEMHVNTQYEVR